MICDAVLHALHAWFSFEDSIREYCEGVGGKYFLAAYSGDAAIGFLSCKVHNPYTAEIYVMGIHPAYHRHGIGAQLLRRCEAHCKENGHIYLTVKTVDASAPSEAYAKTRAFYHAVGFRPLEVFPDYWDRGNPCLLMAKHLFLPE